MSDKGISRDFKLKTYIFRESLVYPKMVLLTPLYIKLGSMKQLINVLPQDGECVTYLRRNLSYLSDGDITEGLIVCWSHEI